jgi:WD40 repeat protein
MKLSVNRSGSRGVSCGFDGTLKLWDLQTGSLVREFGKSPHRYLSLALTSDGGRCVAGGVGGLTLWDVRTGRRVDGLERPEDVVWSVAAYPGGGEALSGSEGGVVRLWKAP